MTYTPPLPDSFDNVIDSRDVVYHIDELRTRRDEGNDWDDEQQDILTSLAVFAEEGKTLVDWEHGAILVRESYFISHAMEMAVDLLAVDLDAGWPNSHIDWESAAEELQMDYTPLDFDGVTYWAR